MLINIPFDNNWKSIAVSLSGGADSALLTYLLCEKITTLGVDIDVHVISHTRMWKTKPWQSTDSLNVYNWLVNKFTNIKFQRHTNFIAPELEWGNKGPTIVDEYGKLVSGDNIEIRAFAEYVCHHNDVDAYFNGVTRNPKSVDFKGMHTRDIDKNESNGHLEYMIHMNVVVSHPFRFIDKSAIVSEYKKKNIYELFELTRSCEGEFSDIDYTNYTPGQYVPICSECFWCKEREWAIKASELTQEMSEKN